MAEYKKSQSKQQVQIDDMSEAEVKDKLKRLMGGGLGAARVQNELDELQEQDPEEIKDGYQLRFVGKDYARLQAGLATETVIVPNNEHNSKPENKDSKNLFITGDNLDALKHLENSYTGKVDVIYIDPPYNTGSDGFVYSDNFSFSDEDLQLKLGLTKDEVKRLRSLEGKSSHSAWLTFMYPRLLIAKRLLKDTGVIFISIDDNEQANLKILCDEIFVESNFVGNIAWESKTKSQNTETAYNKLQPKIEHIFCYTRKDHWRFNLIQRGEKEYPKSDEKGEYREQTLEVMNLEGGRGRQSMVYEVEGVMPPQGKQWQLGVDSINEYKKANDLFVRNGKIILKVRPENEKQELTDPFWGFFDKSIGTAESAKKELTEVLDGPHGFETVKPVDLIKRLLFHASKKDSLVMDFFSGSGTTGHAVMQLNADDKGKRQHIQVQLPEAPDESKPAGRVAINAGYKTIDEIARKRLELAADKIRVKEGDELPDDWDGGYQHFTLAHASDVTLDKLEDFDPNAAFADDMITPFAAESLDAVAASGDKPNIPVDGSASGTETLLATWLCDDGFGLTPDVTELDFADAKAHLVDSTLYIIDKAWSTASTKALLNAVGTNKLSLSTIILYPYSFGFTTLRELKDSLRTNLDTDHTIGIVERF